MQPAIPHLLVDKLPERNLRLFADLIEHDVNVRLQREDIGRLKETMLAGR